MESKGNTLWSELVQVTM